MDTFTCEKYHCTLTRQACADRQAARTINGTNRIPTYPGCQECAQGRNEIKGIVLEVKPTAWWRNYNNKTTGGRDMGNQKIDDNKLKRLIGEGKHVDEIAAEFGVHHAAVRRHIKLLGLMPNYRRKPSGVEAAPAPVRQQQDLTYKKPAAGARPYPLSEEAVGAGGITPGQIIPVTLRLNVEVNVRVVMEGLNAA